MAEKISRIIIVFLMLCVVFGTGLAHASKEAGFEGAWFSIDLDGSNQWLWIKDYFGAQDILLFDDGCTACSNTVGERSSCVALGNGHISDTNTLSIDSGSLYCYWDEGVEKLAGFNWETEVLFHPDSDTIEIHEVVWERAKNKDPEKIIDPITIPKPTSDIPYSSCGDTVYAHPYVVAIAAALSDARTDAGFGCLQINQYLINTAQNHADYMALNDVFSRDEIAGNPGYTGETWEERILASGYDGDPALEFIAMGSSADQAAQMWLDDPLHYEYLLDPNIGDLGVGFSGSYWVADFGKP